jgi:hypothetical protein
MERPWTGAARWAVVWAVPRDRPTKVTIYGWSSRRPDISRNFDQCAKWVINL